MIVQFCNVTFFVTRIALCVSKDAFLPSLYTVAHDDAPLHPSLSLGAALLVIHHRADGCFNHIVSVTVP
jgi:hypothetical protein